MKKPTPFQLWAKVHAPHALERRVSFEEKLAALEEFARQREAEYRAARDAYVSSLIRLCALALLIIVVFGALFWLATPKRPTRTRADIPKAATD